MKERFLPTGSEPSVASVGMTDLYLIIAGSAVAAFRFGFGANGNRKREEIDEAFSILRVVAAHGEAGEIRAIKRERRFAADDVERTFPELQPDAAGDALLRNVEETSERLALRGEPHTVVNKIGVANGERLLQMRGFAIDGQPLKFAMRGNQQRAAGSFVCAS